MRKISIIISLLFLTVIFVACGKTNETNEKITFTLDWFPNTNHTGVYVAKEMGYFEEVGLDVEIIQPGSNTSDQLVASDAAQFGISYQEGVSLARSEDIPVVSIAAVIQHNTSGFASLKNKGITRPKDFENKKYGGWGMPIELATIQKLMEEDDGDFETIEEVIIGDMDFFAASETGEIDFAWIFEGWTGIEANLKGIELNYIDLGEKSEVFDYYTPVIITSEKNIKEKPEMVEKFMEAVAKGYNYAITNPEDAAEILIQQVPELNPELVKASQLFLADKYQDDAPYWGYQDKEVWERYTNWLVENEFINEIDIEEAYTNDFLGEE